MSSALRFIAYSALTLHRWLQKPRIASGAAIMPKLLHNTVRHVAAYRTSCKYISLLHSGWAH